MKAAHPLLLLLFLLAGPALYAQTYTLNWASSFSTAWGNGHTSGSAANIGGSGITATVNLTKSGGVYTSSNGSTGQATPTVSGSAFVVGGSTANLEIAVDFDQNTEYIDIVYHFSAPVTHVAFEVADLDKPTATSTQYFDEVVVSGSNGTTTHLPTITRYSSTDPDFLILSGNTAHASTVSGHGGNSASSSTDQKGTVVISFGTHTLTGITIRYKNASGAQSNPPAQGIAIGNVSFQKAVPVPVKFTYVKARAQAGHTLVEWQTAEERNNSHFEVERSVNGSSWAKVGTVAGGGTTSELKKYSFPHPETHVGIVHYRLRQVDADGRSSYSIIVSVTHARKQFAADVYPNPITASSVITLYADGEEEMNVTILDAAGRTRAADVWPVSKGANELPVSELGNLGKGNYILNIHNKHTGHNKTIKLVGL